MGKTLQKRFFPWKIRALIINHVFMLCSPVACSKEGHLWMGLVLFVIGAVILLERFDLIPAETWDYLWPSILVVSGLKLMISMKGAVSDSCGSCSGASCLCEETCEMPMEMPITKKPVKKSSRKK